MSIIILDDRIKEISRSVGTGDFSLDEAANGFSSFDSVYSSGDRMFYAISDGDDYEIGSGVYKTDGTVELLERHAFRSTNSDALVDFNIGVKEVYVTYPGRYAVFTANGVEDFQQPQKSGVAIWESNSILNYDSNFIWDKSQGYLGLGKQNPSCAIDVGGHEGYSHMNVSGITVGNSGIMFSGEAVAIHGRQTIPFQKNEFIPDTNTEETLELSGIVNQYIGFKKQPKSRVFAGPSGNCGCVSEYPTFRPLRFDDIEGVNQIINDSGNFAIPTFANAADNDISADQAGVMAFITGTNELMIANGTSWVSITLN
jgi:hypothetical protein